MRVLIIKMSSMGDLIHTLPAITDAQKALPNIHFDWVVEESFVEIPSWHPSVKNIIPISIRSWRKNILRGVLRGEIINFIRKLREYKYDYIIDAQGLLKSSFVSSLSRGLSAGMDYSSCKESLAACAYRKQILISKNEHAIERIRILFAQILGYNYTKQTLDYGVIPTAFNSVNKTQPYLVFLHSSSRENKLWSIKHWKSLAKIALANGFTVYVPWSNEAEKIRAKIIANNLDLCMVLPKMNLTEIASLLYKADAVVGVDTGLSHLAAVLSRPGVTIYVDTNPKLTGTCGVKQICLSKTKPEKSLTKTTGLKLVHSKQLLAQDVWHCLTENFK